MNKRVESMIISGGGPAGLALALKVSESVSVLRIIDKRAFGILNLSRASGIQPRLFPILNDLNILSELVTEAQILKGNKVYVDGQLVKQIEFREEKSGKCPLTVDQSYLEQLLVNALREKGVVVEEQKEAIGLILDINEFQLRIKDHRFDIEETTGADLIVACDGGTSVLRRLSGIQFPGFTYPENPFISDCQFSTELDHEYMHYFTRGDLRLVIVPLPGNTNFKVSGRTDRGKEEEPEVIISDLFERMSQKVPMDLKVKSFSYYKSNARVAEKFADKNLFLCGDSAHAFPPHGGQGLNCAVEDAHYLGSLISEGLPISVIKHRYSERRSAALQKLEQTTRTKHKYTPENIPLIDSREETLRIQEEEL